MICQLCSHCFLLLIFCAQYAYVFCFATTRISGSIHSAVCGRPLIDHMIIMCKDYGIHDSTHNIEPPRVATNWCISRYSVYVHFL